MFFSLSKRRQKARETDVYGQLTHFHRPLINLDSRLKNKKEGGNQVRLRGRKRGGVSSLIQRPK